MHKVFEFIVEVIGWLRIVASPTLIGIVTAAAIYYSNPTTTRLIIAMSIVSMGLLFGIAWANSAWKKTGTMQFLSRIMATPELDDKPKQPEKPNTDK